jgi:hypothetical protein
MFTISTNWPTLSGFPNAWSSLMAACVMFVTWHPRAASQCDPTAHFESSGVWLGPEMGLQASVVQAIPSSTLSGSSAQAVPVHLGTWHAFPAGHFASSGVCVIDPVLASHVSSVQATPSSIPETGTKPQPPGTLHTGAWHLFPGGHVAGSGVCVMAPLDGLQASSVQATPSSTETLGYWQSCVALHVAVWHFVAAVQRVAFGACVIAPVDGLHASSVHPTPSSTETLAYWQSSVGLHVAVWHFVPAVQ